MRGVGTRLGSHHVSTVLAEYDVCVYVSAEDGMFRILVPTEPGGVVMLRQRETFLEFKGRDLGALKVEVSKHLTERDVTDFHDVIECDVGGGSNDDCEVRFNFRVARVSTATYAGGTPKLERLVKVTEGGEVVDELVDGEPEPPSAHQDRWRSLVRVPYTASRWRKCVALRESVGALKKVLVQIFEGADAGEELDRAAVRCSPIGGEPLPTPPGRGESSTTTAGEEQ